MKRDDLNDLELYIKTRSQDVFKLVPLLSSEMPDVIKLKTFSSCLNSFRKVAYVFDYCCQIADFADFNELAKGTKLESLLNAVLLKKNDLDLNHALKGARSLFETLLIIASYLAIKRGDKGKILNAEYLSIYNVYKYRPLKMDEEEYCVIRDCLCAYRPETNQCLDILKANFRQESKPVEFLDSFKKALKDERAFDLYPLGELCSLVFEERALAEVLSISISNIGDGGEVRPLDPNFWTEELLFSFSIYFNDDEDVKFCLEIVGFLCHKKDVGWETQERIVERAIAELKSKPCEHRQFLYLFDMLKKAKKIHLDIKKSFFKDADKIFATIEDVDLLDLLGKLGVPSERVQKRIGELREKRLDFLLAEGALAPLLDYLGSEDIHTFVTKERLEKISELFYSGLPAASQRPNVAFLYSSYGSLLTSQKVKNVVNDEKVIETETLKLWKAWKKGDYAVSTSNFHVFAFPSPAIPPEKVVAFNEMTLRDPLCFGRTVFLHSKDNIKKCIGLWNSFPFYGVRRIEINEDFPQKVVKKAVKKRDFPSLLAKELNLFSNVFAPGRDAESYFNQYYDLVKTNLADDFKHFNRTVELYGTVSKAVLDANLLEYDGNQPVSLALVIQLFPLLENLILEEGVLNGIPPLNSQTKGLAERMEPSDMLITRMEKCFDCNDDLETVSDLIAVYHMMYDKRSLNIRNRLVHGTDYPFSEPTLAFAFKATLISAWIVIKRIQTGRIGEEHNLVRVVG